MTYDHLDLRAVMIEGEVWFVQQDLHVTLPSVWADGLADVPSRDRLVIDISRFQQGKSVFQVNGGGTAVLMVNEPGVIQKCLRSEDRSARNFVDWILREAGPSLRAVGLVEADFVRLPVKRTRVATFSHQVDRVPTTLYRMLDAKGSLLYVGISMSSLQRLTEHKLTKEWWRDIARIDFQHYPSRTEAREAERRAIAEEGPRYNIAS